MDFDRDRHRAGLCALGAVLFWSTAATAFKLTLKELRPVELLFFASAISLLVLGLLLGWRGRWGQLRRTPRKVITLALLLGVLNPFLYYLVLFAAYDRLPGQVAMTLNYGWPLVLSLLAVPMLGQRIRKRQAAGIVLSFLGAVLVVTGGQLAFPGGLDPVGLLLALGSTVVWAFFWLGNARVQADPVILLFLGFVSGTLLSAIAVALGFGFRPPSPAGWAGLTYIGTFEMGLSFVLWLTALQWTRSAARIGQLVYLAPFLSLFLLHLFLQEPLPPSTPLGLLLLLAGIALARNAPPAPSP
jgi:drug/metabolite transporter (DMT)-like permease